MPSAAPTIAAVMLTIWPEPACSIRAAARCVMWKKPARLTAVAVAKSASRIVDERLGNEDAGIVHQRVDASIALDGRADDALGSVGRGDIAVDRQHRGISRNIAAPDRAGSSRRRDSRWRGSPSPDERRCRATRR